VSTPRRRRGTTSVRHQRWILTAASLRLFLGDSASLDLRRRFCMFLRTLTLFRVR